MRKHTCTNRCTPEVPYVATVAATSGQARVNAKRTARAAYRARLAELTGAAQ